MTAGRGVGVTGIDEEPAGCEEGGVLIFAALNAGEESLVEDVRALIGYAPQADIRGNAMVRKSTRTIMNKHLQISGDIRLFIIVLT